MSLKRFFGALLTVIGISALIFASVVFFKGTDIYKALLVYGLLGLLVLIAGVSILLTKKDDT